LANISKTIVEGVQPSCLLKQGDLFHARNIRTIMKYKN